jgi:signal transduction histidine kinase/ligand-binding sensor domain-containing protein/DNA-binding response OmpR family regulator
MVMRRTILTMCFVLFGLITFSQQPDNKKIIKYALKDGLSSGFISNIVQDERGLMWFNSRDAINRFDGTNFKIFKFDAGDPDGLPGNLIQYMYKDKQDDIWISSLSGIYNLDINTEHFIKFKPSNISSKFTNSVNSISADSNSILWFACNNEGLFSYNKVNRQVKTYSKANLPGLSNNSVITTFHDSQGLLWVGGLDSLIAVYHTKNDMVLKRNSQVPLNLIPKGRINLIYEDHYNNVWIATSRGLAFYHRRDNKMYVFDGPKYNLQSNYFFSLLEDKNDFFIGLQDGGLYKMDLQKFMQSDFKHIKIDAVKGEDNYNITERSIETLYLDKDKNVWAGTFGDGIYMLGNVDEKFQKFQPKVTNTYGTSYIRYFGICMDADGYLWMGTDGNGIFKQKQDGSIAKHYYADGKKGSLTNNAILSAGTDHLNNLWFGSYARGLFKYDKKTDGFINYIHNDNDPKSLCSNDVRAIFEDSQNNLWIGTNRGGVSMLPFQKNTFINYTIANSSILTNNIMAICGDNKNNLLLGTYGSGLISFLRDKNKFVSYFSEVQTAQYLPGKVIYSLKLYDNKILIGTVGDGLVIYNIRTRQFKSYTEKTGLANNTINAIQPDDKGNIWLSTNKGISEIEKSGDISNYDISSGLQTGHFNSGSVLYNPKGGFMCFGGTEGYNVFFPGEVKKSTFKPKVMITGLQLFGKEVEVGKKDNVLNEVINQANKITLKPDQSVFTIQYVALNYAFAEKDEFAYQLVGLDKTWNYVRDQKSATYRYLEPGEYEFKVKAANQDGIWFDNYASIKITILPPWYKTLWAYLAYFSVAVLLIYSYKRYKTAREKLKYDIKIAHITAQKEKEIIENKLSFFTNISHEFRTPLTLIINPVKELLANNTQNVHNLNELQIIYRNTRRLLSLVDQLLLFRKAENENDKLKVVNLDIVQLCKGVLLCFSHQFNAKNIRICFESVNEEMHLYVDREKIEIVLFNLLSNALKFTPVNGEISCKIEDTPTSVMIKVKDSGCGIANSTGELLFNKFYQVHNETTSNSGFGIGLYLVKTFVESHKGNITYDSTPGLGTEFCITLLKGKEHLTHQLIFEDVNETSVFLEEMMEDGDYETIADLDATDANSNCNLYREKKTMLIVEDNLQIRQYLKLIFADEFQIIEADNGEDALQMVYKLLPNFIISDVIIRGLSGVELCRRVKTDLTLNHIPVILLTASSSPEIKLQAIEVGADDYMTKPFEKEMLVARVNGLLKSKNDLKEYFYNEITLKSNDLKVPADFKEFLDRCIKVVELHLAEKDFCIKDLASEIGMSHSNLYKKIKSISGQSANEFIRFIRLRKAAEIFLNTDCTVAETAFMVGINDMNYFREQFTKLFGLNPSSYIKKFRQPFHEIITRDVLKKQ